MVRRTSELTGDGASRRPGSLSLPADEKVAKVRMTGHGRQKAD